MAVDLTSITPRTGHVGGGGVVVIVGTDFEAAQGGGGATIGGNALTINSWGDTNINATVPSGVIGLQDLVVTNDSESSDTISDGFEYTDEDDGKVWITPGIIT